MGMLKNKTTINVLLSWIPLALVCVLTIGTSYGLVQQNYRQSANDPQVQIIQNVSDLIESGTDLQRVFDSTTQVDISKSLDSFVIIFDENMNSLYSTGILDGKTPSLPKGVLDATKRMGQHTVTWEPKKGVRIAAVVQYVAGTTPRYVLAGKSIRVIEKREDNAMKMAAAALAVSLATTLIYCFVKETKFNK